MNAVERTSDFQAPEQLSVSLLNGAVAQHLGLTHHELNLALGVANLNLQSGNPRKALEMYAMLVLCSPLNAEHQAGLANCALQLQEYELTLQAASAVVAIAPRDPRGYYFSAAACSGMGCHAEAQQDIKDALTFTEETGDAALHQACATLYQQLKTKLS